MKTINIIIVILFILAVGQIETSPLWGLFHGVIGFVLFIHHHVGWKEFKAFLNDF